MEKSLQELNESLERVQALTIDYTAPLKDAADVAQDRTLGSFAAESDPDGRPWAPVKPETERRKKRGRYGRIGARSVLRDTDAMYLSFLNSDVEQVTPTSLSWGSDDPKAWFHQEGTSKMPARPMVGLTEGDMGKIDDAIADHAEKAVLDALGD